MRIKYWDVFTVLGITCLIVGLVGNRWLLGALLAPDGEIKSIFFNIVILVLQSLMIFSGVICLMRERRKLRKELMNYSE